MLKVKFTPSTFRPAAIHQITGYTPEQQRDLRKRGYGSDPVEGWSEASLWDAARLLFVRTLRDSNIELAKAWQLANEEVLGAIIVHACRQPTAIQDETGEDLFGKNPSYRSKAAFDVTGMRAVAGPIFAWGPALSAGAYASVDHAKKETKAVAVISFISLPDLGALMAERAGVLAIMERR